MAEKAGNNKDVVEKSWGKTGRTWIRTRDLHIISVAL